MLSRGRATTSMALVGNAARRRVQALAFRDLVGIPRAAPVRHRPGGEPSSSPTSFGQGFESVRVAAPSVADAVRGADIVTAATADKTTRSTAADDPDPACTSSTVGGDCPARPNCAGVLEAAAVFVENTSHRRAHRGDLQQMPADFPSPSSGACSEATPGRRSAFSTVTFDSVGFEGLFGAHLPCAARRSRSAWAPLDLVARATDQKNLFGLLHAEASARRRTRRARLRKYRQVAYGRNDAVPPDLAATPRWKACNAGHGPARSRIDASGARSRANQKKAARHGPLTPVGQACLPRTSLRCACA